LFSPETQSEWGKLGLKKALQPQLDLSDADSAVVLPVRFWVKNNWHQARQ